MEKPVKSRSFQLFLLQKVGRRRLVELSRLHRAPNRQLHDDGDALQPGGFKGSY